MVGLHHMSQRKAFVESKYGDHFECEVPNCPYLEAEYSWTSLSTDGLGKWMFQKAVAYLIWMSRRHRAGQLNDGEIELPSSPGHLG